ncbi:MAG: dihydrofolate reductase, partial [Hyphomicrobiaceae bacterium]
MPYPPCSCTVTIVVAVARNGVIGRQGDMPWQMRSSLRRFRSLPLNRPMIMGRQTFEAIGKALDG